MLMFDFFEAFLLVLIKKKIRCFKYALFHSSGCLNEALFDSLFKFQRFAHSLKIDFLSFIAVRLGEFT